MRLGSSTATCSALKGDLRCPCWRDPDTLTSLSETHRGKYRCQSSMMASECKDAVFKCKSAGDLSKVYLTEKGRTRFHHLPLRMAKKPIPIHICTGSFLPRDVAFKPRHAGSRVRRVLCPVTDYCPQVISQLLQFECIIIIRLFLSSLSPPSFIRECTVLSQYLLSFLVSFWRKERLRVSRGPNLQFSITTCNRGHHRCNSLVPRFVFPLNSSPPWNNIQISTFYSCIWHDLQEGKKQTQQRFWNVGQLKVKDEVNKARKGGIYQTIILMNWLIDLTDLASGLTPYRQWFRRKSKV